MVTDLVKDVDGSYLTSSGWSASNELVLSLRMLCGTAESSCCHDALTVGSYAAATGCGAIAGCLSGSTSMCKLENVIAMSRYMGIFDPGAPIW